MNLYSLNEFGKLKSCMTCIPTYLQILKPINEKQKINVGKLDRNKAENQHSLLLKLLNKNNVDIVQIKPLTELPYQIFTRDIGFVIDDIGFISKLKKNIRSNETKCFKNFLSVNKLNFVELSAFIEGGDVFVHNKIIFIGNSQRTSSKSIEELKTYLGKAYKFVFLNFDHRMLHLDCVFNIVDDETVFISNDYFFDKDMLKEFFVNIINIPLNVTNNLGLNFLPLSTEFYVSSSMYIKNILFELGKKAEYIDYSELIKVGGGIRCSILPLDRA